MEKTVIIAHAFSAFDNGIERLYCVNCKPKNAVNAALDFVETREGQCFNCGCVFIDLETLELNSCENCDMIEYCQTIL